MKQREKCSGRRFNSAHLHQKDIIMIKLLTRGQHEEPLSTRIKQVDV